MLKQCSGAVRILVFFFFFLFSFSKTKTFTDKTALALAAIEGKPALVPQPRTLHTLLCCGVTPATLTKAIIQDSQMR